MLFQFVIAGYPTYIHSAEIDGEYVTVTFDTNYIADVLCYSAGWKPTYLKTRAIELIKRGEWNVVGGSRAFEVLALRMGFESLMEQFSELRENFESLAAEFQKLAKV